MTEKEKQLETTIMSEGFRSGRAHLEAILNDAIVEIKEKKKENKEPDG